KSGRRGSNTRHPAWEIGRRLKINNNRFIALASRADSAVCQVSHLRFCRGWWRGHRLLVNISYLRPWPIARKARREHEVSNRFDCGIAGETRRQHQRLETARQRGKVAAVHCRGL